MVHHQEGGRLTLSVYPKPTQTDRYLSFHRTISASTSELWLNHWLIGPKKVPTLKFDRIKDKQRVILTLQSKGYPKRFILEASKPKPLTLQNPNQSTAQFHTLKAPLGHKESFGKLRIKVAFKPYQTMNQMFSKPKKTKWTKKKLVIPFTTFFALIVERVTLVKRRKNS